MLATFNLEQGFIETFGVSDSNCFKAFMGQIGGEPSSRILISLIELFICKVLDHLTKICAPGKWWKWNEGLGLKFLGS